MKTETSCTTCGHTVALTDNHQKLYSAPCCSTCVHYETSSYKPPCSSCLYGHNINWAVNDALGYAKEESE